MRKTKVGILGLRGIPRVQGGIETHCEHLYPFMTGKGYDFLLFARANYVGEKPYTFKGIEVRPLKCSERMGFEAFLHTLVGVFHAKAAGVEILHIHAIGPAIMAPLARLLGMKVVVTHHGPDYDRAKWGPFAKFVLRVGEKLGVRFANELIVISQTIGSIVQGKHGRENYHLIFNGVQPPQKASTDEIEQTLKDYGLRYKSYVLTVGRLVPEKGFHTLVDAFAGQKEFPPLVIAGSASPETSYSRCLKEQTSESGALMTGFVTGDTLRHLYQGAELFVLPSSHEGLPIALLEAMSHGCKVLVSDIPANLDVDLPPDHYFSVGDIESLRSAIRTSLQTESNGDFSELVSVRYDWKIIAAQTLKVYDKISGATR
jgi:starch synthase